jgi:hypothetical protein
MLSFRADYKNFTHVKIDLENGQIHFTFNGAKNKVNLHTYFAKLIQVFRSHKHDTVLYIVQVHDHEDFKIECDNFHAKVNPDFTREYTTPELPINYPQ